VELDAPARIAVGGHDLAAVPTTHGAGALARALAGRSLSTRIHAYFHDTDLVSARRRLLIVQELRMLGLRRPAADLEAVAATVREHGRAVAWEDVARGEAADPRT
jgi:hypothetical protein